MPKKGYKQTKEHIEKTSWPKGKTHSEEARNKLRDKLKGRVFSEETRRKMSESAKKKKLSEEHKRKISEAGKRREPPSEETREKLRQRALERGQGKAIPGEETRRKMSEARKGKKRVVTERMKLAAKKRGEAMKGIPMKPETREKFSQAMKGRIISEKHRESLSKAGKGKHSGPNAPNYIDGRTKESYPYPAEFTDYLKKKVRKRDEYLCQVCYETARGKRGHVHHIDGDKNNCQMGNLTLICISCHNKIHSCGHTDNERLIYFRGQLKPENRPFRLQA